MAANCGSEGNTQYMAHRDQASTILRGSETMLHVQLSDRRLVPFTNVWFDRCIPPQGSILGKLRKSMERWHLPQDFWTTIEKGVNHYTEHPHKLTIHSKENEPQKPFGVTFNTPRNLLHQAFRTQSHIGWDNFLKGRISRDWLTYVRHNKEHPNGHSESKVWSEKII
jgi:hypothetical protein